MTTHIFSGRTSEATITNVNMESNILVKCLILCSAVLGVDSYGSGAPASACANLQPGHYGVQAQNSATPYTISASSTTYSANQQITVTITGTQDHQGLLVQARKSGSATPIGTFSNQSANTKPSQCTAASDSWTHSNTNAKSMSTVTWTAPASDEGSIMFMATVAQNKQTYWLNHQSSALTFSAGQESTTMAGTTGPGTQGQGGNTASAIGFGAWSTLAVIISVLRML